MTNEQLVMKIKTGEDVADNMLQLWTQNKGIICKLARKCGVPQEFEDLKNEGYFGLCQAVDHYDYEKEVPFVNYAAFWIKQTMVRYVENCSGIIRLPVHTKQGVRKYKKVVSEYRVLYGYTPSNCTLCNILNIGKDKLHTIQKSAKMEQLRSLSESLGGEEDITLEDVFTSEENIEEDVIHQLDFDKMKGELWKAVDTLPSDQSSVLHSRYGNNRTLQEISNCSGIDYSTVRGTEKKAINTLRLKEHSSGYEGYFEEYMKAHIFRRVSVTEFKRTWTSEVEREVLYR